MVKFDLRHHYWAAGAIIGGVLFVSVVTPAPRPYTDLPVTWNGAPFAMQVTSRVAGHIPGGTAITISGSLYVGGTAPSA